MRGEGHRHHRCELCGRNVSVRGRGTKRNPDRTDRIFLYELWKAKTGRELQRALRLRWGRKRSRLHKQRLWRQGRIYYNANNRTRVWMVLKRLLWLADAGYIKIEDQYVEKKRLWRTLLVKKRYYALTEFGRAYVAKFAEELKW